jgi:tripartite-type tricarboxylate transporter receptor subunit TctC
MLPRRSIMKPIRFAFVAVALVAGMSASAAQSNYPEKSIRLIYGFPAGSDTVTRIFADKFAEALGKPVIVDNVSGAAGNIAADRTAKAAPDGYTIGMLTGANITINAALQKLPYDPVKDLVPVSLIFGYPNVLLVSNDVPAKNVGELVALARAHPGKLTYGHNGVGTTTHLSAELFKTMAHIDVQDVPYRGPTLVVSDMMSGLITISFNAPGPLLPLVRDNKIRALAVTSRSRAPFAPELPTMEESGFAGFDITVWFGLFVPAGTPPAIIEVLNREAVAIMSAPDMRKRVVDLGDVPLSSTPREFAELIRAEKPFWTRVIRDAGIKPIE